MDTIALWEQEIEQEEEKQKALEESKIYNFYGDTVSETAQTYMGSTKVSIGSKTYEVFFNGDEISKEEYDKEIKDKLEKKIKAILKNENTIKKQVYELYKKQYDGDYNGDMKKDKIDGFEVTSKDIETIGIFFSNLNQFFTLVKKDNKTIVKDSTHIY